MPKEVKDVLKTAGFTDALPWASGWDKNDLETFLDGTPEETGVHAQRTPGD